MTQITKKYYTKLKTLSQCKKVKIIGTLFQNSLFQQNVYYEPGIVLNIIQQ